MSFRTEQVRFEMLTGNSNERRARLGILLRRRTSGSETQTANIIDDIEGEERGAESRTGEYYEFLWEEMRFASVLL
jgi:hypothetical protein